MHTVDMDMPINDMIPKSVRIIGVGCPWAAHGAPAGEAGM